MKTCLDLRVDEEVSGVLSSQSMGEFTPQNGAAPETAVFSSKRKPCTWRRCCWAFLNLSKYISGVQTKRCFKEKTQDLEFDLDAFEILQQSFAVLLVTFVPEETVLILGPFFRSRLVLQLSLPICQDTF